MELGPLVKDAFGLGCSHGERVKRINIAAPDSSPTWVSQEARRSGSLSCGQLPERQIQMKKGEV